MAAPDGDLDLTPVLEVPGAEDNATAAKDAGDHRCVSAINNWGERVGTKSGKANFLKKLASHRGFEPLLPP